MRQIPRVHELEWGGCGALGRLNPFPSIDRKKIGHQSAASEKSKAMAEHFQKEP